MQIADNHDEMSADDGPIRDWLVAKTKAFLDAGFYDDEWIAKQIWHASRRATIPFDSLIQGIRECPEGDGDQFRDVTAESLVECFGDVVDGAWVRTEFPSSGGRGDIEFPLSVENLGNYYLWQDWSRRYEIRSILVETKNTRTRASIRDVQQTLGYLVTTRLGGFAFLVSRKGFSRNAIANLRQIAQGDKYLILPFDETELCEYIQISSLDRHDSLVYLRRKQTRLLRAA